MALDYTAATVLSRSGGIASRPQFVDYVSFPGDSSYATGGYLVDDFLTATVGADRKITSAWGHCTNGTNAGYDVRYNPTTGKLLVVSASTKVEISNATDLSGFTFYVHFLSG